MHDEKRKVMIYALTYELKSSDKDYASLFNFLEHGLGSRSIHVLRDSWWIVSETEFDISKVIELIRAHMGDKDHFYFSKLSDSDIDGWLPTSAWDFFRVNVGSK